MSASQQTKQAAAIAASHDDVNGPDSVTEALRRVMRDLPGIGKDQTAAPQQGGYSYRGIEQIARHAQPLFSRHHVVFVPHVETWEVVDIVVNGKPWTDTRLAVSYTVYGPGGPEDHITVGPLLGIGRDNSDKGANKALTQTFKYALLQVLAIADAKDDADGSTHEADAPPLGHTEAEKEAAKAIVLELAGDDKDLAKEAWQAIYQSEWTREALTAAFDAWVNEPPAAGQEAEE